VTPEEIIKVKNFLNSKRDEIKFKRVSPDILIKAVKKLGAEVKKDDRFPLAEGFEWDWWVDAIYKGNKFCLSGSGFYGTGRITRGP